MIKECESQHEGQLTKILTFKTKDRSERGFPKASLRLVLVMVKTPMLKCQPAFHQLSMHTLWSKKQTVM